MWDTENIRIFNALSALRQVLVNILFTLAIPMMTPACKVICEKASGKQVSFRKRNIHTTTNFFEMYFTENLGCLSSSWVTLLHFPVLLFFYLGQFFELHSSCISKLFTVHCVIYSICFQLHRFSLFLGLFFLFNAGRTSRLVSIGKQVKRKINQTY